MTTKATDKNISNINIAAEDIEASKLFTCIEV